MNIQFLSMWIGWPKGQNYHPSFETLSKIKIRPVSSSSSSSSSSSFSVFSHPPLFCLNSIFEIVLVIISLEMKVQWLWQKNLPKMKLSLTFSFSFFKLLFFSFFFFLFSFSFVVCFTQISESKIQFSIWLNGIGNSGFEALYNALLYHNSTLTLLE